MFPDKNPQKIQKMFNEISSYYDMMNNFISLGTHYIIKTLTVKKLDIQPNTITLDLFCGTGDFVKIISKLCPKTKVIGLDFSENMLKLAQQKNPNYAFIQADASQIPFKESEFDYITAGFGLRNVENRSKVLDEIYRTLKQNGKFLHLDFNSKSKISCIFNLIVKITTKICAKNSENYNYLLKSKNSFPSPDELIREFETHGFKLIKKYNYLFGIISAQIMEK